MPWTLIWRLGPWALVISLIAISAFYRSEAIQAESNLAIFTQATATAGEQAAARNKEKTNVWKQTADAADRRARGAELRLDRWLRDKGASGSVTPASSGTPRGTDRAGQVCYDEAQLNGALRRFAEGVAGIAGDGEAAVIDRQQFYESWPR